MTNAMTPPDVFFELAGQLAQFREAHGRLPVQCGASDPQEKKLGDFLRAARRNLVCHKRGDFEGSVPARIAHLDEIVPGWRTENVTPGRAATPNVEFSSRVHDLARFMNRHNRIPRARVDDSHERTLGKFVENMKQARKGRGTATWNEHRAALLNRQAPGWDANDTILVSFDERINQLRAFVLENQRAPRRIHGRTRDLAPEARLETTLAEVIARARASSSPERQRAIELALAS